MGVDVTGWLILWPGLRGEKDSEECIRERKSIWLEAELMCGLRGRSGAGGEGGREREKKRENVQSSVG